VLLLHIINVQGRKSRFRDVGDLERLVRDSREKGICRFFVTDDNLARTATWRLMRIASSCCAKRWASKLVSSFKSIRLPIEFPILSTRCIGPAHIIFIGLESINSDNLESAKSQQNRIERNYF
jgi:hypothetical protein